MSRTHTLGFEKIHHAWNRDLEPTLTISSGDIVELQSPRAGYFDLTEDGTWETIRLDEETVYCLIGPIEVEGAEPGDTLQIDFIDMQPAEWGWSAIWHPYSLLPERFTDGFYRTFDLRDVKRGYWLPYVDGISVPVDPMFGTIGTPMNVPGDILPMHPLRTGGNLDTRFVRTGTSLFLPIECSGAKLSVGDGHSAQGDGEVSGPALECDVDAAIRITLHKNRPIEHPEYIIEGPMNRFTDELGYRGTTGTGYDLLDCARQAVSRMIDWIMREYDISETDAFILCCFVGDLKIHEIVNDGVMCVGFTIPEAIFDHKR